MPWVLVFHLFGVVFWLGSLLVITSLLAQVADEVGAARERFIVVARRLFVGCNLGAGIAILLGIGLIEFEPVVLSQGWLHVKLLLAIILLGVHIRLRIRAAALEDEPSSATGTEFRVLHAIVSLLLLAILLLTILKPF